MGYVTLLLTVLDMLGIVKRQDTKDLIQMALEKGFAFGEKIVLAIVGAKKEPTPEEVIAMKDALVAGRDRWDQIMGDWN